MPEKFAADYIDVAERIASIRGKADREYPEGSFQPLDHGNPYRIEVIEGQTYIVYVAAFYRTPDDPRPGVGAAWEPVPGKTPYTRGSELQNAETSAWGRALVATLAADTKRGIASQEEVRNRRAEQDPAMQLPPPDPHISKENREAFVAKCKDMGIKPEDVVKKATGGRTSKPEELLKTEVAAAKKALDELAGAPL